MAKYVTAIRTAEGDKQIDYNALANLPDPLTLVDLGVKATASELNVLDGIKVTTKELNALKGITVTANELNYVDGATANIQTQLNEIAVALRGFEDDYNEAVAVSVPVTRTINGKTLDEDIVLTASDVGAAASEHLHDYLPLSGGTLTGTTWVYNTSAAANLGVKNDSHQLYFHLDTDGTRGVYDYGSGQYVFKYNSASGKWVFSGNITGYGSYQDCSCVALASGSMPAAIYGSGSTSSTYTFDNAANYALYIVEGITVSGSSIASVVIPGPLSTTVKNYQYADEENYVSFNLYASGTDAVLSNIVGKNSGVITAVYGIS